MAHPSERRTKIVATIGPASDSEAGLRALLDAGADVLRVNLSHASVEESIVRIDRIRAVSVDVRRPVGILVDLPGPKVRTAPFGDEGAVLETGSSVRIVDAAPGSTSTAEVVGVSLDGATAHLTPGDRLGLGDGGVAVVVTEVDADGVRAHVENGGVLRGRPGISLPDARVPLTSPTEEDLVMLEALLEHGEVDAVAVSFARSARDIHAVKAVIGERKPMVVVKVETAAAVDDLDAIVAAADGVMVARGDLGVRLPLEDLPHIQKQIIRTSVAHGKPVITATQMLESMITARTPTRAEVTDVANAVFDGTSAVMLSGETAIGNDPANVVATMSRITARAEQHFDHDAWGRNMGLTQLVGLGDASTTTRITSAITAAAWRASTDADLAAIIACTNSGDTARMISRFRPTCPILAMTPHRRTARKLAMAWGITPMIVDPRATSDDIVWHSVKAAAEAGAVHPGDIVAVLVGSPTEDEPTTDVLRLVRVR